MHPFMRQIYYFYFFMWVLDIHYTKFKYFVFSMISYWLKHIFILLIKQQYKQKNYGFHNNH